MILENEIYVCFVSRVLFPVVVTYFLSLFLFLFLFFFLHFSFVSNDSLSKWDQSTANLTEFLAYLALVIFISTPIPVTSCMFRFSLFFGFGFSCFFVILLPLFFSFG